MDERSGKRPSMREGPLAELFRNTQGEGVAREPARTFDSEARMGAGASGYVAVIRVVGVGGAGGNAINRMVEAGLRGVEFVAVNTDRQALDQSEADARIPVGLEITHGLGTGGDPHRGEQALRESEEQLRRALRGSDLVFIAAGEGGGTGSGGAPVVAKVARELGALTIGVVTRPFGFEGSKRTRVAEAGLAALKEHADTLIVIPNDRLMTVMDRGTSIIEAFKVCDDLLRQGVQGICDLITLPGIINLDFADVRTIIRGAGTSLLGIGYGAGEGRALNAAEAAINSPLLEIPIDGARGILLGITGGPDLSLIEVNEAARVVADAADPDANIIFGATIDPELEGQVWVTVVAANFSGKRAAPARDADRPQSALRPTPARGGRVTEFESRDSGTVALAAPELAEPPEVPDLGARFDLPYPAAPPAAEAAGTPEPPAAAADERAPGEQ